VLTELFSSDLV
jgi:hypothetical protein